LILYVLTYKMIDADFSTSICNLHYDRINLMIKVVFLDLLS